MKKIICFLLFCFPIMVHATTELTPDPFTVIVTNPNGATFYNQLFGKTNTVIPYNTILQIESEILNNNIWYGKINDPRGYINLEDVTIYGSYDLNNAYEENGQLYTYDSVTVYNGPSKKYNTVLEIPAHTTITYTHMASSGMWAYILYNNTRGWLYIGNGPYQEQSKVAFVNDNLENKIMILNSFVTLYETPDLNATSKTMNLEENTVLDEIYTFKNNDAAWVFINYNGNAGWVPIGLNVIPIKKEKGSFINIKEELIIHSLGNNLNTETIEIALTTPLTYEYTTEYYEKDKMYYVYYEEKYYWIKEEDNELAKSTENIYRVSTYGGITIKSTPSITSQSKDKKIPSGGEFIASYLYHNPEADEIYQTWAYTTYEGVSGWIYINDHSVVEIDALSEKPELENPDNSEVESNDELTNKLTKEETVSLVEIILYSLLGLLSLLLIVALILSKKNKNKPNYPNVSN